MGRCRLRIETFDTHLASYQRILLENEPYPVGVGDARSGLDALLRV